MYYLVGNWKMHTNVKEALRLAQEIKASVQPKNLPCTIVLCPPFIALDELSSLFEMSEIEIGAQNMYYEEKGAFTGEISPLQLKNLCSYVILGHSERRQYFGETDELINKKVISALTHDLRPILCVGETLDIYEKKETFTHIEKQLLACLQKVPKQIASKILIAYEPCWAIGTGKTPEKEEIEYVSKFITLTIEKMFSTEIAEQIPVLYGGSVKAFNVVDFVSLPHVKGALVGGASIDAKEFIEIVNRVSSLQ